MSTKNTRLKLNRDGTQREFDQRKKQIVDALSKRYKELNELWENAEKELKLIPVPVNVQVPFKSVPADPISDPECKGDMIRDHLGFAKSKGGWRICHSKSHDGYPEYDFEWTPITDCAVDLRLEAAPHLGRLREEVLKAAEECVPRLDSAIAELRSTVQGW
jgi:hypothetical protein